MLAWGALGTAAGVGVLVALDELGYTATWPKLLLGLIVGLAVRRGAGGIEHWGPRMLGLVLCYTGLVMTRVPATAAELQLTESSPVAWGLGFLLSFADPISALIDRQWELTAYVAATLYLAWRLSAPKPVTWGPPSRRIRGAAPSRPAPVSEPKPLNTADEEASLAATALFAASTYTPSPADAVAAQGETLDVPPVRYNTLPPRSKKPTP